jgi:hypothetical protein
MVLVSKGRTQGHEVEQKMSWIMDQVEVDVNDMVMVLQGSVIGIGYAQIQLVEMLVLHSVVSVIAVEQHTSFKF